MRPAAAAVLLLLFAAPVRAGIDMLLAPGLGDGCLALASPWQLDEAGQAIALARPLPAPLCPPGARLPEPNDADGSVRRLLVFDANRADRLLAFAIRAPGSPPWQPETGMWWSLDPDRRTGVPGSGLFLEVQGRALSVWLASYDATGRAEWWMAAGELNGMVFHGELLAFDEGAPAFRAPHPPRTARSAGQIAIRFHAPARAEVWLAQGEQGGLKLHGFEATRFVFGTPPGTPALAGEWEWTSGDPQQASPLRLRLAVLPQASGQLLADLTRWLYLRCDPVSEGVPARCALFGIGSSNALVEFDAVGVNLLTGRDADGREHQLRRMMRPAPDDRESPPRDAGGE